MTDASLQTEPIHQRDYPSRTPDDYLSQMPAEILASLTPVQLNAVRIVLTTAIPQPSPKIIDLRFGVDLIISRFYLVLFVGKDRRRRQRQYLPEAIARIGNSIAAVVLILSLSLLISTFIFLFLYLVKSAVGIDISPHQHLGDRLQIW